MSKKTEHLPSSFGFFQAERLPPITRDNLRLLRIFSGPRIFSYQRSELPAVRTIFQTTSNARRTLFAVDCLVNSKMRTVEMQSGEIFLPANHGAQPRWPGALRNPDSTGRDWVGRTQKSDAAQLLGSNMMVLLNEKIKILAEETGWSLDRATGYLEGERYRRNGQELSAYLKVGIDDYARGFRAGYYKRDKPSPPSNIHDITTARQA